MLLPDTVDQIIGHHRRDQPRQRFGACRTWGNGNGERKAAPIDVLARNSGENPLKRGVLVGTEEGKWRNQRPCADPGYDREFGAVSRLAPSVQQARAIGSIVRTEI